jgi:hypothetical protein
VVISLGQRGEGGQAVVRGVEDIDRGLRQGVRSTLSENFTIKGVILRTDADGTEIEG